MQTSILGRRLTVLILVLQSGLSLRLNILVLFPAFRFPALITNYVLVQKVVVGKNGQFSLSDKFFFLSALVLK